MPEPPFIIPGQTGNREETGLVSWTVPWYVESLDDIFSVGYEPPLAGLIEVSRRWSQIGSSRSSLPACQATLTP